MITYEQARQHAEYSRIPEHVLQGVYGYVEHRCDRFLVGPANGLEQIVAQDRLQKAARSLRELVVFLHMEVRADCHGNQQKVHAWLFPPEQPNTGE